MLGDSRLTLPALSAIVVLVCQTPSRKSAPPPFKSDCERLCSTRPALTSAVVNTVVSVSVWPSGRVTTVLTVSPATAPAGTVIAMTVPSAASAASIPPGASGRMTWGAATGELSTMNACALPCVCWPPGANAVSSATCVPSGSGRVTVTLQVPSVATTVDSVSPVAGIVTRNVCPGNAPEPLIVGVVFWVRKSPCRPVSLSGASAPVGIGGGASEPRPKSDLSSSAPPTPPSIQSQLAGTSSQASAIG